MSKKLNSTEQCPSNVRLSSIQCSALNGVAAFSVRYSDPPSLSRHMLPMTVLDCQPTEELQFRFIWLIYIRFTRDFTFTFFIQEFRRIGLDMQAEG